MSLNLTNRVIDKSASYTISKNTDRPGTIFTNRGATGAVTFTLPPPGAQYLGVEYKFAVYADQNVIVAGAAAGDLVYLNDQAANSLAAQTAGQKIGARMKALCLRVSDTAYKWLVTGDSVGHTFTVAT